MSTHGCQNCHDCQCGATALPLPESKESLWQATVNAPHYESLKQSLKTDVVIVGAGVTGLVTAYELQQLGKKVIIVEAAQVGSGVTGYTTAHLTSALDIRYYQLVKQIGRTKAQTMALASQSVIDRLEGIITKLSIDCDFTRLPGYLYSEEAAELDQLRTEAKIAKDLGLPVEFTTTVPLPFPVAGAVQFNEQAQFHPLKFVAALAKAVVAAGGQIFENSRVTDIQGTTIITESGRVEAGDVVLATHTPITAQLLSVQAKLHSYRSYVLGLTLSPASAIPRGLFWDTAKPYHYIRSYTLPEEAVVLVGGADHPQGDKVDTTQAFTKLEKYSGKRLPIKAVPYAWSAQIFMPVDRIPYIGRAPFRKNIYVATGFMGNGFTFGPLAGQVITTLIQGQTSALTNLLKPSRITLSSMGELTRSGWHILKCSVLDRFNKTVVVTTAEGKVVLENGKKIAIYQDEAGHVTKLSAVCTHAGCIVQWNGAAKTWDCPCHGSRFKATGEVIEGPAVKNLPHIA